MKAEKSKKMKKKIWIPIVLIIIVILCIIFFVTTNSGTSDAKTASANLEEYKEDVYTDWTFRYVDNSEEKSEDELKETNETLNGIIKEYNDIVFNMNEDTKDYTEQLNALYVSDDISGSNKGQNPYVYQEQMNENTVSSYQDFTELCFTNYSVGKNEYETVTIVGYVTNNRQWKDHEATDLDTVMKYTFMKIDDSWKIYKVTWGKYYTAGTLKTYEKNGLDNTIVYKGDLIGYYAYKNE